jgi:prolyl oligopeptidase
MASSAACSGRESTTTRPRYPATRKVDVVDDYHGTKVPDPYRWLEDLDSQEVRDWAAAQSAVALPILRENNVRPWLLARVAELQAFWNEPTADSSAPPAGSSEPPLIDERSLPTGQSIADVWPSADRKHAAYAVSTDGSEWVETRIRRLSNGTDLDERLDGLLWSNISWTKDNRGFFYVRSLKPALGERTAMKGPVVYYHVLGTPQSSDVAIFRTGPEVTDLVLEQELSADGRYLFIYEGNGAHVEGIGWLLTRMYAVDLGNPLRPALAGKVVPLSSERDGAYRVVSTKGDSLYLFTDRGAPRRRLVVFDIRNPAVAQWRDVVPQTDDVIDQVYDIGGRFVVQFLRNVQHGIRVYERNGQLVRELAVPPMTMVTRVRARATNELVVEAMEGFAPTRKRYDVVTGQATVERGVKLPFPADAFEMKQVWYSSKDGVRVPMFLAHRRGLVLDGSHPTVVFGYGASSQLSLPFSGGWAVASLELGLVLAMPALRGGGEFGRAWYDAGTLERKQTTFDDYIAATEYLIREKYTSPEKLAIIGASNGGLLVTTVINQRPDLFRVAVAGVPQTDNLRYDRGRHNTQFGTPNNPAHFPFLYAYSPLHNVKPGTCYPSTLLTTALNDERAPAWMALKHAATLQAAQSCDRPVILRADTGGGHGGNESDDASDFTAFVVTQLGVKVPNALRQ